LTRLKNTNTSRPYAWGMILVIRLRSKKMSMSVALTGCLFHTWEKDRETGNEKTFLFVKSTQGSMLKMYGAMTP
jgi:hypothetical protein